MKKLLASLMILGVVTVANGIYGPTRDGKRRPGIQPGIAGVAHSGMGTSAQVVEDEMAAQVVADELEAVEPFLLGPQMLPESARAGAPIPGESRRAGVRRSVRSHVPPVPD